MGRETLLTLLILLFGGLVLQPLALLPWRAPLDASPSVAERAAWRRLWMPVLPVLLVGVWLCGWALREPDPVRTRFDHGMIIGASLPFAALALRAALRALWVLVRQPLELPICTVGFLRPRVVFDPYLARTLDEGVIHAALEHERAHARHRDPLRLWLAQLAVDLQWPWPWAHRRLRSWLELLEQARDDEALRHGASGTDLAAAVVAAARHARRAPPPPGRAWLPGGQAALLGDANSLSRRVERLLAARPQERGAGESAPSRAPAALALLLLLSCAVLALGVAYGNDVLHPFLLWTWKA
ncbi:hypothetical protein [Thiomonas sp. FB-6]|uniref:hypothetical protein n=1 Tax=Thiomonas sp. FB-6 TaxID=1158291 RepID=UPI0003692C47|nr:hypothetical protein [Thiomonas sp. FB-6]